MAKRVTYADAVELLGGDSKVIRALDNALGVALFAGGPLTLSLFDAKTEAVRLANQLLGSLREKLGRAPRATRTERLVAAHEIIITTAFFEALDDVKLPVRLEDLRIDEPAAESLMSSVRTLRSCLVERDPVTPTSVHLDELRRTYALAGSQMNMIIEVVDPGQVSPGRWEQLMYAFSSRLPDAATRRYEDLYHRLASDFPEFAFWAQMRAHESTQTALAGLEQMLMEVTAGRTPSAKVRSIHALNAGALIRPITRSDEQVGDLRIPSLGEGYVVPLFRRVGDPSGSDLSLESTWEQEEVRGDLGRFLAGHLTSFEALRAPLLVLGQPGAGKSVLTQMLAARLPPSDFLPIRVPLRQVPADAGIQEQIEAGVHVTTGETISWPELARSAEGALPVVLLDGLDELLQATGVNRADYLRQAMEFQDREASLGRPLAVIVTTRTAVADRCRVPRESVALRLEPFSNEQVEAWVDSWNRSTGSRLSSHDVLCYPDLARQPLLLLMLALYDADGAALTGRLRQSELYERLLRRFAAREIRKHEQDLDDPGLAESVEFELLRLSVAAFAMFNRGQQWVTHDDLNRDLSALMPQGTVATTGFQRSLTAAQKVLGRFFFVHQAQAQQDTDAFSTYEFLHATFGEYLIARLIRSQVTEEAEQEGRRRAFQQRSQTILADLLSFAVLAVRTPILRFLSEMREDDPRERLLLLRLFRDAYFDATVTVGDYRPSPVSAAQNVARRTANLVLLLSVLSGPTRAGELFGAPPAHIHHWQNLVDLWRAGMAGEEWHALNDWLTIVPTWEEGNEREITVMLGEPLVEATMPDEIARWTYEIPPGDQEAAWVVRPARTSLDTGSGRHLINALAGAVLRHRPMLARTFVSTSAQSADSLMGALLDAWLRISPRARHLGFPFQDDPWMNRRLLQLVQGERQHLSVDFIATICNRYSDFEYSAELLDCVLYVIAHDRRNLDLVDQVLRKHQATPSGALLAAVTLMELDVDPSQIPVVAFDWVRQMTPEDFEEIARSDPHLFARARRVIRAEGGRYRLIWPGPSPSPSG
ncbi:hypothetical protein [Herbidospora sp. NBRC 101105]|uniref:NACHT domain-containing protein n=1 Tax=Herbidospora sp. NBRC 101105 TaxID=3032195 RepID=UPI0024A4C179|nr:hypothetical protein [Herbidospora sp. NBRC 101105]GLX92089.1 hypothetical protein Hesp01_00390 [Herbidospora sp. NBRC 101105]